MSTAPEVAPPSSASHHHPSVGTATVLLDAYTPGTDRFLATPTRTLLARGTAHEVPHGSSPLAERVGRTLEAARGPNTPVPLVIGAVPFDQSAPAALAVPRTLRGAPPLTSDPLVALPAEPPSGGDWSIRAVPEPEEYGTRVKEVVDRMWRGEFSKVVLARTLELSCGRAPDLPAMLQRLARRDPGGYTFALPTHPGRTLLGASPELLVSRAGGRVVANPLAGSTPRSPDLAEDVRRAAALLRSAKDLHEHAVVVDAVHQALGPHCRDLVVPAEPTLTRTAAMWHLSTTVTGTLLQPDLSALELACELHPTPAVCGTPTHTAREVIRDAECFDRGFFTGMVGWGDANGDGEWVVTLRCAEAEGDGLRLFAGAGIVSSSRPEDEMAETGDKFRTFLDAVGAQL
ncbi:isochorismate synthase [Streptomyces sp. XM4193]|uniref:isochorismate synthase n=1 Tax=Streptomyces sp. XM4193 TaxID=2929782 RepID=UPI001FF9112A|nr:isochorismate synthase [Streptomyces sp. XM4193]MCK1798048.1 isochorismate synthase [Streptomyces sp. XM4193]